MITRIIEPGKMMPWDQFITTAPPFSIALDGYVSSPTQYQHCGPRLNLNHHDGVDRLSTRSTSGQMLIYIKQGLFRRFSENGQPTAILHLNDPDQDGCLSDWLAKNHERVEGVKSEPLISRLIFAEDMLDATAGAYPFSLDSDLMRDIAWIFEPYTEQRSLIAGMSAPQMESIIESVSSRIDKYTLGQGQKLTPDDRYVSMHKGNCWEMINETGLYARSRLFQGGTFIFISYKGERPANRYHYSIGSMSPFENVSIPLICEKLNELEGIAKEVFPRWGGGNFIIGSPRGSGSKLSPDTLAKEFVELVK